MFTFTQLVIINTVLTLVSTGILIGMCIDRREFRNEICEKAKRDRAIMRKEFNRIYDAECDNNYEIIHLKDKEK